MHKRFVTAGSCLLLILTAGLLQADENDFDTQMMRATVKITHEKSTGTGFFLSQPDPHAPKQCRYILVSAAHVFENIPADEVTLYFRKKESEGVYRKLPVKIALQKDRKPCWTKHPSQDVAVLVCVPPPEADLPKLTPDLLATDETIKRFAIHPGDSLNCLGYPHRVEANEAGFPILRSGPVASFPLVPAKTNKTFLLSANVFEGDSGGPVYLSNSNHTVSGKDRTQKVEVILGLVTGQHFLDEEMRMVYGTTKVRHRLGLAIVVQASFIRDTIKRLPSESTR